jgi:O-antigen/teichoic acid export membrane protein
VLTNFAWAVTGNVIFAMCQWGIVVALAKAGSATMVGQFSIGVAIATPILMLANCDLRAVQATDTKREFGFREYLRVRTTSTSLAVAVICAIAILCGYPAETAWIIFAAGLVKAIESLSDVHYGLFQLNGRLDQSGRSMIARGVLAVAAMTVMLLAGGGVVYGCLAIATVWLAVLCLFDIPRAATMARPAELLHTSSGRKWSLVRSALPMGIVTTVAAFNLQIPRYFIHAQMGNRNLGIFSALAYATVAMTLVGDSIGQCVIPRLSRLFVGRDYETLVSHLKKLFLFGCATGLCGILFASAFGASFLRAFYSAEYAGHARLFTLLTLGAAIHFAASMLTSAITASRHFAIQVPMYLAMAACTALGCAQWIPTKGLEGAAFAVMSGAIVRLTVAAGLVTHLFGGRQ